MIVNEPFIQNDMMLRGFFSFLFFSSLCEVSAELKGLEIKASLNSSISNSIYIRKKITMSSLSSTRVSYSMADEKRYGKHEKQGKFEYQN